MTGIKLSDWWVGVTCISRSELRRQDSGVVLLAGAEFVVNDDVSSHLVSGFQFSRFTLSKGVLLRNLLS